MDGGWALILSAVVTAVGGVIVALVTVLRKENKADHAVVRGFVTHIFESVDRVETKVDKVDSMLADHLTSHRNGVLDNGHRVDKNGVTKNKRVSSKGISRGIRSR